MTAQKQPPRIGIIPVRGISGGMTSGAAHFGVSCVNDDFAEFPQWVEKPR